MPFCLTYIFLIILFSFNLWKDIDWTRFYLEKGETEEEGGWENIRGFWQKYSREPCWPAGVCYRDPLNEITLLEQLIGCFWQS